MRIDFRKYSRISMLLLIKIGLILQFILDKYFNNLSVNSTILLLFSNKSEMVTMHIKEYA